MPVVIDWTPRAGYPSYGAHWADKGIYDYTLAEAFATAEELVKGETDE